MINFNWKNRILEVDEGDIDNDLNFTMDDGYWNINLYLNPTQVQELINYLTTQLQKIKHDEEKDMLGMQNNI